MAAGAFLAGLPGLALASGRSPDAITVTWRREIGHGEEPSSPIEDPVVKLRQLKAMLDESLITVDEYEAKKHEILDRM